MKIIRKLGILILLAFLLSGAAFGETLHVPSKYETIQDAIGVSTNGDTVVVAPGTYSGPIFLSDKTITIRSESGPDVTIIEGILDIAGGSPVIEGFKLSYGLWQSGGGHGSIWGGSSPTFIKCQIVNGYAGFGGGYEVRNSSATFVDCEFFENKASSLTGDPWRYEGGALYIDETSSVTLTNSTIKDNTAGGNGGGISNHGKLTISNSSIVENDGDFGSGIINYGTMSITNSTISDNGGNLGSSGGIENEGSATLINCAIQRNFGSEGAGIENFGDITMINCNISDNDGSWGIGGILNFGSAKLISTTISGNKGYIAGAIDDVGYGGANVTLINCTVSDNSASASNPDAAGGIRGGPGVRLQNTIVARNTAPINPDCSREIISLGNNLIGDTTGCNTTLQASDLVGDPGLGAFTDDGSPGAGHIPLLSDSQAIDAANSNACWATDQLGNHRVDGDVDGIITCDIGAIEFQGLNQPPVALCQDATLPTEPGLCSAEASVDDGSTDPDGDQITLKQTPPGPYGLGDTDVTLTVTDDQGAIDTCDAMVTVEDQKAPIITSVSANPNRLWPPNHKMAPVILEVDATNNCDSACQIISVVSNETKNGLDAGATAPDWQITDDLALKLRAERSGTGSGRVYTITIKCVDSSGNSSNDTAKVTVPHNKSKKKNQKNKKKN